VAKAYMAIINQVHEFQRSSADPERDLLHWLSKPQSHAYLNKACKEVLAHIGAGFGS
jgi:hypothetical protein